MTNPETIPESLREAARVARIDDPLDPVNLYNLHWKDDAGEVMAVLVPRELSGVATPIAMLVGSKFPSGSLKAGQAYAIAAEMQLYGEIDPRRDRLATPRSGNLSAAVAWVSARMGYETRGRPRAIEPQAEFAGYRFHATATAKACEDLASSLHRQGYGSGRVSAFVAGIGSGATIGAGDRLRENGTLVVGLEPIQCSTLYNAGVGAHRIEGIGERRVPWIQNVWSLDAVLCIDDADALRALMLIQEGADVLVRDLGVSEEWTARMLGVFGASGAACVLGAIKTVKHFRLGPDDLVVGVAADGFDRYGDAAEAVAALDGPPTRELALRRIEIFHRAATDYVLDGTRTTRERWHNQKYFTWVEQLGKTMDALEMQKDPDFWRSQRARADDIDAKIAEARSAS
jgi:cysteine synthase